MQAVGVVSWNFSTTRQDPSQEANAKKNKPEEKASPSEKSSAAVHVSLMAGFPVRSRYDHFRFRSQRTRPSRHGPIVVASTAKATAPVGSRNCDCFLTPTRASPSENSSA